MNVLTEERFEYAGVLSRVTNISQRVNEVDYLVLTE